MTQIDITSYGHSTVRIGHAGQSMVIDPGGFAPGSAFCDVATFLITHSHEDHVDVGRLSTALASDPTRRAWVPSDVAPDLAEAGVPGEQIEVVRGASILEAAGLPVIATLGTHAEIHSSLPSSENISYLIADTILHPGDAFPPVPADVHVDLLFLPMSGPWMQFTDAFDYVDALRPRVIVPIHDGDLNDVGLGLTDQLGSTLLSGTADYRRLPIGETVTI